MNAPSTRALKYLKQRLIELKRGKDKFTVIVRDFNSPLLVMDKTEELIKI